jgi:hypothetical protein
MHGLKKSVSQPKREKKATQREGEREKKKKKFSFVFAFTCTYRLSSQFFSSFVFTPIKAHTD